ncbi:hypothetical protein EW146_g8981 [Bondarzewia mesenterica]|uniref:Uncharacterized protein n=1 Tax=Bondarzewia mesenterica TaxID=1095465 RepID=A0A4S4L9V2_9AGAM|nr:hypothetical protein EW146_g8981 [Bondarzewia mesenterica]
MKFLGVVCLLSLFSVARGLQAPARRQATTSSPPGVITITSTIATVVSSLPGSASSTPSPVSVTSSPSSVSSTSSVASSSVAANLTSTSVPASTTVPVNLTSTSVPASTTVPANLTSTSAPVSVTVPANLTSTSAPASSSVSLSVLSTTPGVTVSASAAASPTPVAAPQGGIGLNVTPLYKPQSDFDFQSLNLALHQELIELDLFRHGLAIFSASDFLSAGLGPEDMFLLQFMADQEVAHAELISNILFPNVTVSCTYTYPNFTNVRDFVDFCQRLTRWGESGVYGFLGHLNAQDTAALLMSSIATEARQQMIFRQFEGVFPMPYDFVPAITQSMTWTLLAPYIASCPASNPAVKWSNYPALTILDNPFFPDLPLQNASVTRNSTQVTFPGREVFLSWETPGKQVGFNNSFTTSSSACQPRFVAWISQLNTTYTPFTSINGTNGTTIQPDSFVFPENNLTANLINGTMFLLVTDAAPYVTPYNLSQIEPHIVAGPAIYQAG